MEAWDQLQKNLYKCGYYASGVAGRIVPSRVWRCVAQRRRAQFDALPTHEQDAIWARVNYYNKLAAPFPVNASLNRTTQLYKGKRSAAYDIDLDRILRDFTSPIHYSYWFGDIVDVPDYPTLLKSRPVYAGAENQHSVLMKFNKIRHYYVVNDRIPFEKKMDKLVWRGKSNQQERVDVMRRLFDSPLCDVGDTHSKPMCPEFAKPFMTIPQQLQYKYILSVEGNDVATNTKWIMASNSLCLMRKPQFETWFMEGNLIPNVHYALLKDDHSDVEEKIAYYNDHPHEAKAIIANANAYVKQFFDEPKEALIGYLVMEKYLRLSGQLL